MQLNDSKLLREGCLIDGEWVAGDKRFAVTNPASGDTVAEVPELGGDETRRAIAAAERVFRDWRAKTAAERGAVLRRWFELMHENVDDLAATMVAEQGKPLAEARGEVGYAASLVDGAIASKYRNTGQTCVCTNRMLIRDSVYETFADKLAERVGQMKVGDGFGEGVTQGPLIDRDALAKVEQHVADALERGARVLAGGRRHALGGTFYEPTVLADVAPGARVVGEETFGPVAPLFRFSSEREAVAMANNTEAGLAAYFYTRDMARSWRVGREGSKYGIEDYLEIKYLCMGGIEPALQ